MKSMPLLLIIKQHKRNYFNMKKKLKKKLLKKLSLIAISSAKKDLIKAREKRNRRKTPYPFGFEYTKERR